MLAPSTAARSEKHSAVLFRVEGEAFAVQAGSRHPRTRPQAVTESAVIGAPHSARGTARLENGSAGADQPAYPGHLLGAANVHVCHVFPVDRQHASPTVEDLLPGATDDLRRRSRRRRSTQLLGTRGNQRVVRSEGENLGKGATLAVQTGVETDQTGTDQQRGKTITSLRHGSSPLREPTLLGRRGGRLGRVGEWWLPTLFSLVQSREYLLQLRHPPA